MSFYVEPAGGYGYGYVDECLHFVSLDLEFEI